MTKNYSFDKDLTGMLSMHILSRGQAKETTKTSFCDLAAQNFGHADLNSIFKCQWERMFKDIISNYHQHRHLAHHPLSQDENTKMVNINRQSS